MGEIADALRRARDRFEPRGAPGAESELSHETEPRLAEVDGARPAPKAHAIPREKEELWIPRAVLVEAERPVAERFRHLAVRVRTELQRRESPVLLVTSAGRGEGKTTTACNLALALASIASRGRVALVELDLRRPSLARALEIERPPGIERALAGELAAEEVCVPTELSALDVYPVRKGDSDAHELLARSSLGVFLRDLARRYAVVVCDTPPVLPVPDVALLAEHAGACLVVARAGSTRRAPFREMLESLPSEKLIGTFLNAARTPRSAYHYYRYYQDGED